MRMKLLCKNCGVENKVEGINSITNKIYSVETESSKLNIKLSAVT
jgi:Ser/Thr protein kinase RdoA (MazF antagonist)